MSTSKYKIKMTMMVLVVTAVLSTGVFALSAHPARADVAGSNGNVSGYVWSSTIGWISLNCHQGGTSGEDVCSTSPYSVNVIPNAGSTNGVFDGYAWSSNIGWISFRATDVAACGAQATVNLDTTSATNGQISGWARALAGNTAATATTGGGWDGCISLRGASPAYGVSYTASASVNNLTGYAWGDVNVGWVNFSNATLNLANPTVELKVNGVDTLSLGSAGGPVALTWTTANLSSSDCSATDAWTGPKSSTGGSESRTVASNATTAAITHTYVITCTGINGATVSDTVTVTVAGENSTDPFLSFLVNNTGSVTVPSGTTVTLSWETQNIQPGSCIGQMASGSFSGWNGSAATSTKTVSPNATYTESQTVTTNRTYILHGCRGTNGTTLTDRSVNVTIGTTSTGTTGTGGGTGGSNSGKPPWQEF